MEFNCSIPPYLEVGKNLYVAHPQGILLGRTTIIGDNVKIYPYASTIAKVKEDDKLWSSGQRRHAKIGNNCTLGYGCKLIGPITLGDNVFVAAGAIVTKDVPADSIVKNVNEIKQIDKE